MEQLFTNQSVAVLAVLAVVLWTLPWKAAALWKSARRGEKWWFFFLLIMNTLGLLEILYIFVFSRPKGQENGQNGQ